MIEGLIFCKWKDNLHKLWYYFISVILRVCTKLPAWIL